MCEKDTEVFFENHIISQIFGKNTEIYRQKAPDEFAYLFDNASKSLTNNKGYPDFFIKIADDILCVVECKANITDHKGKQMNIDNIINNGCKNQIKKYASEGTIHYMHKIMQNSLNNYHIIGIAFSGNEHNYKISIFSLNKFQNSQKSKANNTIIKEISDEIIKFSDISKKMMDFANIDKIPMHFELNSAKVAVINAKLFSKIQIDIPRCQKILDVQKSNEIRDYILDKYRKTKEMETIGVLTIGILDSRYYLLDGQHRYNAYLDIIKKVSSDFDVEIHYKFYSVIDEIYEKFENMNLCSGLSYADQENIDLLKNDEINSENSVIRKMAHDIIANISTKFGSVIKFNKKTTKPYLFNDNGSLCDEIYDIIISKGYQNIENDNEKIVKEYNQKIMNENKRLSQLQYKICKNNSSANITSITQLTFDKCKNSGFYLGLHYGIRGKKEYFYWLN